VNTDRGYTLHEHLDEVGVIHMNGRVYDPLIGRFMSADPFIQAPGNFQSYNRYAYVMNNPLAYTDPSGYFSMRSLVRTTIAVFAPAIAILPPQMASVVYSVASAVVCGPVGLGSACAAASQAAIVYYNGASTSSALQAGAKAGATALLFELAGLAGGPGEAGANSVARYAAHAGAGCVSSVMNGGKCGQGAVSAVFGKFTSNVIGGYFGVPSGEFNGYQMAATIVAGGVGSVIGGGKFENGAATAAYGYLFNELSNGFSKEQAGYEVRMSGLSYGEAVDHWTNGAGMDVRVPLSSLD
jgi:RHS repeat-associated protein